MSKNDYSFEKELLYRALSDSLQRRYEKVVNESDIDGEYPEDFRRKMSILIGVDIRNPYKKVRNLKKIFIGILIAAAITLAGCTIISKTFGPYIEKWFDEYILVKNEEAEDNSSFIDEIYTLTYVPEGYEFDRENENSNMYACIWKNSDGKMLKLIQCISNNDFYADVESGYSFLTELNGVKIYYKTSGTTQSYKWHTSKYEFEIMTQTEQNESEIEKIIEGLALK